MRTLQRLSALLGIAVLTAVSVSALAGPNVGDPAPSFTLPGSDGKTYRLADYKGKQAVVLAWFAKAFTGG